MSAHEPQTAYLFQCRSDVCLFAVSVRENAGNIPPSTAWYGGWRLQGEFALDPDGPPPYDIDRKRIVGRVCSVGYHVWRNGCAF
ncbi:MAG TPA: hypothetical protein VFY92_00920 [Hyphomicrobiaceae bacterium]|nr:hypothetical protein [Hyphomicrobiaceae bacterium]